VEEFIMTKVALIACANGLGHARRLMHVAELWSTFAEIKIFVTKRQRLLLGKEKELNRSSFSLVEIPPIGLQGPEYESSSLGYSDIPKEILRLLEDVDFIFSDNALWPLHSFDNTIFMGHFSWVDYYSEENEISQNISLKYREFLSIERILLSKASKAFLLTPFVFGSPLNIPLRLEFKMPRYEKKPRIYTVDPSLAIVANGTTSQSFEDIELIKERFPDLQLVRMETFLIPSLERTPKLVIGRPGLGTIRDCAEYRNTFFPVNADGIELKHNVEILEKYSIRDVNIPNAFLLDENILSSKDDWSRYFESVLSL
jgi:hypothetical protein